MQERPIRPVRKPRNAISSPQRFATGAQFLLHLLNEPGVAIQLKIKAAVALLPYEGKKMQAAAAAVEAAVGPYAPGAAPKPN